MIQENRRPLVLDAPDADLLLPERGLELRPVLAVGLLDIGALFEQALEDEVLDQVGGRQDCATRVQGFEDLLSVLGGGQVDDDDLKQFAGASLDGLCSDDDFLRTIGIQPFSALLREELMRLRHP